MGSSVDRRAFLASSSAALAAAAVPAHAWGFSGTTGITGSTRLDEDSWPEYPTTPAARARDFVGASHTRIDRVREMLAEDRGLARATWDWGFGDWETAIGAASHTGQIDIIELLLSHGARPDLFTFATLDRVDAVKSVLEVVPGARDLEGPHSISLYAHAEAGNATRVLAYLDEIGLTPAEPRILTREQAEPLLGAYAWGAAAADRFEIGWNERRSLLTMVRPGGTSRLLMPVGEGTFFPSGARHVTIRFEQDGDGSHNLLVPRGSETLLARRVVE